jgi:hypothetical protein
MTRHDRRAQCAETIADAIHDMTKDAQFSRQQELRTAYFMLDALHGIARVNAPEATEEMIEIGASALWERMEHLDPGLDENRWTALKEREREFYRLSIATAWAAMAATGDLTKPPEKKL